MEQSLDELPVDDPRRHARALAEALRALERHAWQDTTQITDPAGKVLFEAAAEVLGGLASAFDRFASGVAV